MKSSNLSKSSSDIFPIYSLNRFGKLIGFNSAALKRIANNVDQYYHPFPKKTGKKEREIANPKGILKDIQKSINVNILGKYNFPKNIVGGIKGRTDSEHLMVHVGKPVVITVDIKDCFPSITNTMVFKIWREFLGCSPDVAHLATRLTTWKGNVPLGASTSNLIAALALIPCIEGVDKILKDENMSNPTQWVDDMAISGTSYSNELLAKIAAEFAKRGFVISRQKQNIMRAHKNQSVLKKNINKSISIPQAVRNKTRAALHDLKSEDINSESYQKKYRSVKGKIHYIKRYHPNIGDKMLEELNVLPKP